jgi:hypothetical protein
MSVNDTLDVHFYITLGGLGAVGLALLRTTFRLGKILQHMDSHMEQSAEIHKAMDRRITWLERRRSGRAE